MKKTNDSLRLEAIALKYDQQQQDAPLVVAKGKGRIAENMIAKAKDHHVPIQEDPSLVTLLSELTINEKIPEELYEAVAEVFAFIYRTDREAGKQKQI